MRRIDSFFSLTAAFQALIAEASLMAESYSRSYAMMHSLSVKDGSCLLSDAQAYRENIHTFRDQLACYVGSYIDLDKLGDTFAAGRLFNETVATMRSRAQKSLSSLRDCFYEHNDSRALLNAIEDLKNAANSYIDICIEVVETNPELKGQRKLFGVEELVERYDLFHLE